jgi:endonuclease/exonuclease/phosphatase family metal-dependent hydrolase
LTVRLHSRIISPQNGKRRKQDYWTQDTNHSKTPSQKGKTMQRRAKATAKKDSVSTFADWLASQPLLTELTLTALTVLFGMQVLRVLVPGMFWILGSRMGWSATELGLIGLLIFLTAFIAGPLGRVAGNRLLIAATAAGLCIVRLFMQVWWGEPLFNLSLAIVGTILFVIFLPACFENARIRGGSAISNYVLGLLGGLALDIAINGASGTYDIVWQVAPLPMFLTLLLVIIQLVLVLGIAPTIKGRQEEARSAKAHRTSIARPFTWLAIGPFLFLELVIFQNIARMATLTGWPLPTTFGLTLVAQLAGLAAAAWILSKPRRTLWPWALGAGILLTASLAFGYQKPAALIALLFIVGQVLLSALIAMVLIGITTGTGKAQRSGVWIANGIGIALLLVFILAYYAVYSISLPYSNTILEPIAGGIVAACAIGASVVMQRKINIDPKLWSVPIFALILLVLPLAEAIAWRTPTAVTGEGFPVRVMTYDLHNGFNTKGKLNIEEIAQVIESNKPDIVALQEVSRGCLVNGRLDMLAWLSQRLNMPYVFGPTADHSWGNAILSRYPILAYSREDLPSENMLMPSGFIVALIDLGNDQRIKVITTQFHHPSGYTDIGQLQSKAILDFWASVDHTILLGDLNAEPTDQEIVMLQQADLIDAAAITYPKPAYTFDSDNPHQRLDYIWTSSDLHVRQMRVPLSTASDHLPVFAVIDE